MRRYLLGKVLQAFLTLLFVIVAGIALLPLVALIRKGRRSW